ncbi:MAG: ABC transporter ATP-binding protein/permease [Coriobacteriia bacterium]|nr:ABC transporter ATP-binding protein/permease [Coriobacteriia bacterium]
MRKALVRSIRFLRRYRWLATLAVVCVLASSATDLVGPQILRAIIDTGIAEGDLGYVLRGSLALVGVAIVGGVASFLQGYLSARVSHGVAFDMRNTIFEKLQDLSFSYHDRAQTGQLITRVTSDVDLVREFVGGGLVQAVSAVLILVGAVALLLVMNVRLAVVAFVAIPATLAVLLLFVRRLGPMFREFQARLGGLNSVLQENVAGIRVVKAFAREDFEAERYRVRNQELLDQGLLVRRTVANAFPLLFSMGSFGVILVTGFGAVQIVNGTMTVGELVAFTSYLFLLLQPLYIIGFGAQGIARASASAERLFEIVDAQNDVVERTGAMKLESIAGRVEFRDVHLRYPGDTTEVLRGVSFSVEPDTTVAVVGATGSGKTSLVNLIPRFYDVESGAVLVDGNDVRDVTLSSLRKRIGMVMQDSVLFSGSVRDNITYGRPDASDEEVVSAAAAAQADEFIRALPDEYDTLVGERGVKLSGGQRQRIAIARALLIDPRILIMDDSTSSVDAQTEAALRANLDTLMAGRTTFIVAQRLSTVKRAETILVIDDGRIADTGSHDELLERSCLYAEIAASQLVGAERLRAPDSCSLPGEGDG